MKSTARFFVGVSLLVISTPALAQQESLNSEPAEQQSSGDEIVVTGTLVRGIAPPGTNVIGVTDKAVQESGATSTAQLLQTIPQLGTFNGLQSPVGGFSTTTTNRPNLRNLPGFSTSGSSPTLVLVDGHRVVGAGISVTSPDADIVPPGAIERIEIVPDGGSAIYGSDAVAGVINFITKKSYDGLEIGGHFGFADDYFTWDVNATAGHTWNGGSVYVAYNYAKNDAIFGRDRDYVFFPLTTVDGVAATSLTCVRGNVTTGTVIPGSPMQTSPLNPDGTIGTGPVNQCDPSDNVTFYPKQQRHSVLAGLTQDLTDNLTFDVKAFYTNRRLESSQGFSGNTTRFGPAFLASFGFLQSPFFSSPNPLATNTVYYSLPNEQRHTNTLSTWGVSPGIKAQLGGGWQLRVLTSYGESEADFSGLKYDTAGLDRAISLGLINPYNLSASNPAVLAAVQDYEERYMTRQRQFNARAVIDGELFALPGGGVKLALGTEYLSDAFIRRSSPSGGSSRVGTFGSGYAGLEDVNGNTILSAYGPATDLELTRNVKSAFGELVVPIFGTDNATTLFRELTISAAGRYDKYSDFGDTFNPKFGVTWKPADSVRIRGAWGKSFVAPSLADDDRTAATSANFVNYPFLLPSGGLIGTVVNGSPVPAPGGRGQLVVLGSKPGIQSQKATTWSLGVDFDPVFIPDLHLSTTWWNIDYQGVISIPNFTNPDFYSNFIGTPAVIFNPTPDQLADILAQTNVLSGTSCGGNPVGQPLSGCYVIIDARKQNLARTKVSGLDFSVNYVKPTGFGSIDLAFNGNYELKRDLQATSASAFRDQLAANFSRFKFRASLGAQVQGLRAQVTWNHTQGYDLDPAVGVGVPQTHVSSFNVFDVFLKYDVPSKGTFENLSFTLNVNNAFDQDPPEYRQQMIVPQSNGYINGSTLGRLIQFGINKKF
ncbi:TonB-dependent receptor domain-containing protein [Sphingobium boeckii]|uniref:Iron complex outermembrane receptor protein n=1 Tax=Sphingobium boeckii TaxID=1082345 RepID=A0A7W9ALU5_9SPHN|nr:TonB-dependent receptor [Sphingobium boeckii]MBB5687822.1 iron complex outermembrane receptor protein [Sphingobium boeckii]